jgi:hypothetical protein
VRQGVCTADTPMSKGWLPLQALVQAAPIQKLTRTRHTEEQLPACCSAMQHGCIVLPNTTPQPSRQCEKHGVLGMTPVLPGQTLPDTLPSCSNAAPCLAHNARASISTPYSARGSSVLLVLLVLVEVAPPLPEDPLGLVPISRCVRSSLPGEWQHHIIHE